MVEVQDKSPPLGDADEGEDLLNELAQDAALLDYKLNIKLQPRQTKVIYLSIYIYLKQNDHHKH